VGREPVTGHDRTCVETGASRETQPGLSPEWTTTLGPCGGKPTKGCPFVHGYRPRGSPPMVVAHSFESAPSPDASNVGGESRGHVMRRQVAWTDQCLHSARWTRKAWAGHVGRRASRGSQRVSPHCTEKLRGRYARARSVSFGAGLDRSPVCGSRETGRHSPANRY